MSDRENALLSAAVLAHLVPGDEPLPPGKYEVYATCEGAVDGMHGHVSQHGQLTVSKHHRTLDDVLETAVALLLEDLGSQAETAVATLVKRAKTATIDRADARRVKTLLRQLRKLTGVEWTATPTYKVRT